MINVGVVSANSDVAFNMSSVVCRLGSHCETLREYDFAKIKQFDIVILDIDNISSWHEQIKKDVSGFEDFVVLGVSRDQNLIAVFSSLFKVIRKPLRAEHVKEAIADLKKIVKTEAVVNTEPTPIYTPTGTPTFVRDAINTDVFSDEEMSQRLSKIINAKYKGPSEKEFLKKIEADNIPITEPANTIPIVKRVEIDLAKQFVDDALVMYRAKKLRQRKLTQEEILIKVKELLLYDAARNSQNNLLKSSELENKFNTTTRISDELKKLDSEQPKPQVTIPTETAMDFDDTHMDIEAQRREAIGMHEFVDTTPTETVSPSSPNTFSQQELKYIKNSAKPPEPPKEQPKPTVPVPKAQGVVMDKTELSKKMHKTMTPEQIEKLRKLGIKI